MALEDNIEGEDFLYQCKSCNKIREPRSQEYVHLAAYPICALFFVGNMHPPHNMIRYRVCDPCADEYIAQYWNE